MHADGRQNRLQTQIIIIVFDCFTLPQDVLGYAAPYVFSCSSQSISGST